MALTTVPVELANLDGAVTINESSADADFRVESNANTHMLFVDAGNNRIGINDSAPQQLVDIYDSTLPVVRLTNGRNEGSGSDYDLGKIEFFTDDSSGTGARVLTEINAIGDAASAAPGGIFVIKTAPTNSATVERLRIDSAGYVTMPSQPAFRVKPSTNQSNFAIDGWVDVAFGNEAFDVGDNFASSTFTAPVTGKYQLNLQLRLNNVDSAANFYQARINTSNQIFYTTIDPDFGQDAAYWTFILSIFTDMDASDTATVGIFQSLGTSQTDVSNDSHFSGYLVA
tara:strand:- start:56 stop:910 length:855 start_codon:yes stop_codon:yes gene_type:complete